MGIMPDSWIRKMAEEKGMIDPFVDKLEKKIQKSNKLKKKKIKQ